MKVLQDLAVAKANRSLDNIPEPMAPTQYTSDMRQLLAGHNIPPDRFDPETGQVHMATASLKVDAADSYCSGSQSDMSQADFLRRLEEDFKPQSRNGRRRLCR